MMDKFQKIGIKKLQLINTLFKLFINTSEIKYKNEIMKIYLDSEDNFDGKELTFISSLLDNHNNDFEMFLHYTAYLQDWNLETNKYIGTFERFFIDLVKYDNGKEINKFEQFKLYYDKFIKNIND